MQGFSFLFAFKPEFLFAHLPKSCNLVRVVFNSLILLCKCDNRTAKMAEILLVIWLDYVLARHLLISYYKNLGLWKLKSMKLTCSVLERLMHF